MSAATLITVSSVSNDRAAPSPIERERQAQKLITAFVLTGLGFMLLPGTFLGVWNLIAISSSHSIANLSPAWIQAHGHAQIFGWIGTFILGVGLYSLRKMQRSTPFPIRQGWICWTMWTTGVLLRWLTNIYAWHWRLMLPLSAALELGAFVVFYQSVRLHRSRSGKERETWTILVIGSTMGFLLALLGNLALALWVGIANTGPAFLHVLDQRLLVLSTWGFLVIAIWGFNAKWLPVFIGIPASSDRSLLMGFAINLVGVVFSVFGFVKISAFFLLCGAIVVISALHIFEKSERSPKTLNVHRWFPAFIRIAYIWLGISAVLTVWAAGGDHAGGIWGASRHALTVGFIAAMVFSIGQRVLPAFCGMKILFSPALMLWSLLLLNCGCFLRATSEIPAYEGYWRAAWHLLPISAILELAAVTLFALNIIISILKPLKRMTISL